MYFVNCLYHTSDLKCTFSYIEDLSLEDENKIQVKYVTKLTSDNNDNHYQSNFFLKKNNVNHIHELKKSHLYHLESALLTTECIEQLNPTGYLRGAHLIGFKTLVTYWDQNYFINDDTSFITVDQNKYEKYRLFSYPAYLNHMAKTFLCTDLYIMVREAIIKYQNILVECINDYYIEEVNDLSNFNRFNRISD